MSSNAFDESIAALGRFLIGRVSVAETLEQVAQLATDAIPSAAFAGITMLTDGTPTTAVFTDTTSPEIDRAQYDSGDGPCLQAYRTGEVFIIESTADDGRWPAFARAAADHGIQSTLSLPMIADGVTVGALNLYSKDAGGFGEAEARNGLRFAHHAAIVMINSEAYWEVHTLSETLQEAMASRAVIEQAKGIIMAQSKVGPDVAFDLLVRASQRENRKLRDIARELVDRHASD